jgi:A/G-specific adenine glycosylase
LDNQIFSDKLIHWFARHKRDLPWRQTRDPYYIWLSEVILQQTRVAQGMPYYLRFVENYPTVQDLAAAPEKDVLRLWQGLGYYSRARNLHTTAKIVVEQHGGVFPNTYQKLLTLKGIGTYTAAAIASFAFGERVAVLDGNVYRVLSRIFGEETDIASHQAKKIFTELATSLLPTNNSDTHNQAIMEFGAIQCTPASPECMFCPFGLDCVANATGKQTLLPVKSKKIKVKERFFHYFRIEQKGQTLMHERTQKDIWTGLYEFYLIEKPQLEELEDLGENTFLKEILANGTINNVSEPTLHILTHQRIKAQCWHITLPDDFVVKNLPQDYLFFDKEEIENLGKPVLISKFWD